jgi:hypothetical protein
MFIWINFKANVIIVHTYSYHVINFVQYFGPGNHKENVIYGMKKFFQFNVYINYTKRCPRAGNIENSDLNFENNF